MACATLLPAFAVVPSCSCGAPAARKPAGYWQDQTNLSRELRAFQEARGLDLNILPTATELRAAGRVDLYRAVQRQGGFSECARRLGLSCSRRPTGYWSTGLPAELRAFSAKLATRNGRHRMPSMHQLRVHGRADLLNAVRAAGGVIPAARSAGLAPHLRSNRKRPTPPKKPRTEAAFSTLMALSRQAAYAHTLRYGSPRRLTAVPPPAPSEPSVRRTAHEMHTLDSVMLSLREFAVSETSGRRPLQRELAEARRHDLLNALRAHGGLEKVGVAAGLEQNFQRRPRGYWENFAVLEHELREYMSLRGLPGLMPRRDELIHAERRDLVYAIAKHGGFSAVSARLHLVWVGPRNFWRVFRNLSKRLHAFIRLNGPRGIMPSTLRLHQMGRIDLVYGVAMHGGVMVVARRLDLRVRFAKRSVEYWSRPDNVCRELNEFLTTEPLEFRTIMPSSVALVRAGRPDLANGIRDHGGWVYYAQRLGLRFALERRLAGFWEAEHHVYEEFRRYVDERYGDWDFPGVPDDHAQTAADAARLGYVPSLEMLKRDGRCDIAFAIQRYHGGEAAFAERHNLHIADDTVHVRPVEVLRRWGHFMSELRTWITHHGAFGVMPSRLDFIRTGRHDLRYACYYHGGQSVVAKRSSLVIVDSNPRWLSSWLAAQAARLALVLDYPESSMCAAIESEQSCSAVPALAPKAGPTLRGQHLVSGKARAIASKKRRRRKKRIAADRAAAEAADAPKHVDRLSGISEKELAEIRERFKHVVADDIIEP